MKKSQINIPVPPEMEELFLEAPALVSLAKAGQNESEKEKAKQAALKLFHTETFSGPKELQDRLNQVEPYFEKVFNHLDATLPKEDKARTNAIKKNLQQIFKKEYPINDAETTHWKNMLSKFAMYVFRSHGNIVESFFAPFTKIYIKEYDNIELDQFLEKK